MCIYCSLFAAGGWLVENCGKYSRWLLDRRCPPFIKVIVCPPSSPLSSSGGAFHQPVNTQIVSIRGPGGSSAAAAGHSSCSDAAAAAVGGGIAPLFRLRDPTSSSSSSPRLPEIASCSARRGGGETDRRTEVVRRQQLSTAFLSHRRVSFALAFEC